MLARQGRAGQGRAGQGRAGQGRAASGQRQGRVRQAYWDDYTRARQHSDEGVPSAMNFLERRSIPCCVLSSLSLADPTYIGISDSS